MWVFSQWKIITKSLFLLHDWRKSAFFSCILIHVPCFGKTSGEQHISIDHFILSKEENTWLYQNHLLIIFLRYTRHKTWQKFYNKTLQRLNFPEYYHGKTRKQMVWFLRNVRQCDENICTIYDFTETGENLRDVAWCIACCSIKGYTTSS